jgi:hypothetical protein
MPVPVRRSLPSPSASNAPARIGKLSVFKPRVGTLVTVAKGKHTGHTSHVIAGNASESEAMLKIGERKLWYRYSELVKAK